MKLKIRTCVGIVLGVVTASVGLVSMSSKVRAVCYDERSCALFTSSNCNLRCASVDALCTWKLIGQSDQPVIYPVSSGYATTEPSDEPPDFDVCYEQIKCNLTLTECTWPTGDPDDEFFCEQGPWIGEYETVTFVDYSGECD
jgi:hypothetical protein